MYVFTHGLHRGMLKYHNNENEWIQAKHLIEHLSQLIILKSKWFDCYLLIRMFPLDCCCCMCVSVWKCMQIFLDFPFNWMTIRVIPWKIQNNFHVSLWWVVRSVRHATVEMEIYHVIISVSKSNHSKLKMVIFYLCNKSKIVRHFVSKTYESSKSWVHILFIYDWIITMAGRQCYSVK